MVGHIDEVTVQGEGTVIVDQGWVLIIDDKDEIRDVASSFLNV